MKRWVSAKIHGIRVTDASVVYNGSVSICAKLMDLAGIEEYEEVQVVNLATGGRWTTYALKAPEGEFTLNGGGARLGVKGDQCVVMTYRTAEKFVPANVVFCSKDNSVLAEMVYGGYAD